jgi:hypothetical protein
MTTNTPDTNKGYARLDYSTSMLKANLFSLIFPAPVVLVFGVLYGGIWGFQQPLNEIDNLMNDFSQVLQGYLIFLGILTVGVVVHELIHGLTWQWAAKKPRSAIKYGFQLKTLTPYAHCREPMPVNAYRLGVLMPGLLTGVLPAMLGILTGNFWMVLWGAVFILAAGGDLLIFWLIRNVIPTALVEDHPTRAGCYVLLDAEAAEAV